MFAIHQGFKRIITLRYTKADGTPGEVEGVPVWSIVPPLGASAGAIDVSDELPV